jgi:hypothetical protein
VNWEIVLASAEPLVDVRACAWVPPSACLPQEEGSQAPPAMPFSAGPEVFPPGQHRLQSPTAPF